MHVGEGGDCHCRCVALVLASKEARFLDNCAALIDLDSGVGANVPENMVHALERCARTDARVVIVRHRVEVRYALALLDDPVVRCSKEAVGEAISVNI